MRTLLWSYLSCRRFPRELSAFEVRHFFSLSRRDRESLRKRFRTRARLKLALAKNAAALVLAHPPPSGSLSRPSPMRS
jgi:hypothetical protein